MQNRFKSKILWCAVLAQVVLILPMFVNPDMVQNINKGILALIEILTILGILNNPNSQDKF